MCLGSLRQFEPFHTQSIVIISTIYFFSLMNDILGRCRARLGNHSKIWLEGHGQAFSLDNMLFAHSHSAGLQVVATAVPPLMILGTFAYLPESAMWLISKGRF